ncbi:hypothetical protein NL108_009646, partial [Boleophthalmus pectinirostris]
LVETTLAEGVDVHFVLCVIEGDLVLFVVEEDGDALGGVEERDGHRGASACAQTAALTATDGPETTVRTHCDRSLTIYRLFSDAQVPVGFFAHLKQN